MKRRLLQFVEPGRIEVREEDLPPPEVGQVLVQTRFSAISAGTELLIYRGQLPNALTLDETIPALRGTADYPLAYGYSAVGRVVEPGPEASPEWEGQRVFAFHPHMSHFWASPEELLRVSPGLEDEEAVFLPNMETAVNFLHDGRPLLGEQVLVFGQGIVGLLTTALLARFPLASLVTLDRYALRRKASFELGASACLNAASPEAHNELLRLLQGSRSYAGSDLTFELSGSPAALDAAISATGFGGRIVIGSWYGQKRASLDLGGAFHRSRIRLVSSQASTLVPALSGRWDKSRRLGEALRMIERIRPGGLVTHRIPFESAAKAYELLDQRPGEALQVILAYEINP